MTTFVILFFIIKIVISKNFLFFTSAARFKGVDLPRRGREYGRGWGTKGQKQIRFETFSLFLLRPASARKDVTE